VTTKLIHNCETGEITEVELTDEEIAALRPADEAAWNALRAERNRRLADTDWTVLGDSPTPTAAWKAYRQALRDLPVNTTDPFNPVWPTPPA
jgi:hypothetical protein